VNKLDKNGKYLPVRRAKWSFDKDEWATKVSVEEDSLM
jgi:hypothetical protein